MRILSEDRREKGLTLIELAVVMAIVGIMALFMAPAIGEWVDNFRIRQAARDVSSDLQFAKMKAIGSGVRYAVVFNQIVGGTTYRYVIFPDYDNDLVLDAGSETNDILKSASLGRNIVFDPDKGGGDGTDIPDVSGHPTIAFDRSGLPRDNSGRLIDQTIPNNQESIFLLNTKNNKHIQVTVSRAGRIGINEY